MADITMCKDSECPNSNSCFRYRASPSKFMQSYFAKSPRTDEGCEHYWEDKRPKVDSIAVFIQRMKKINIDVELIGNIPWIYLRSVNGNRVLPEDWDANHGYTLAYYNWDVTFTDLNKTFKLIRKYR